MDFSNTLIRASSLSCLFTEPRDAAAKKAGDLSKTAKTHLQSVYIGLLWGVEKDIQTKQMQKGIDGEESGITLLSRLDKVLYVKNEERKVNQYITGHADIVHDLIDDLKCSWDAFTFIANLTEPLSDVYEAQMQGYLWLWEKEVARVRFALIDTPQSIVEGEKYRLLRSMDVATEESPDFLKAWERQSRNYYYSHIPIEHRVITKEVVRDEDFIAQIPEKVAKARKYLTELHEMHMNCNKILEKSLS
jgi:hypothetical protein